MGAIEAGRAYLKYYLDDKELKRGLKQVGSQLQTIGKIGATATAPLVGAFTAATAHFVKAGSALDDMSQRTGISVETLSALSYAAGQSGTSIDSLESGVGRMQKNLGAAINGTGTFGQTLQTLGVNLQDLAAQSPDQQFLTLSQAIAKIEDPTQRAAAAQKVFGGAGRDLLPLLQEGAEGMGALMKEARDLGVVMDGDTAAAANNLGDAFDGAMAQVSAMGIQIGAAVAGPLTDLIEAVKPILANIIEWIKNNPELVRTIGAVTLVAAGLSAACLGIGVALTILSTHPIVAVLTLIAAIVAGIVAYFWDWTDASAGVGKSLDKITKNIPGGGKGLVADTAKIQADAKAFETKFNASLPSTAAASATQSLGAADFKVFESMNQGILALVTIQTNMLRYLMRNKAQGITVGPN